MHINRLKTLKSPTITKRVYLHFFFSGNLLTHGPLHLGIILLTSYGTNVSWGTLRETLVYLAIHAPKELDTCFLCPANYHRLRSAPHSPQSPFVSIISLHSESLRWLLLAVLYRLGS